MAAQPQIRMTGKGDRCRTSIRKGKTEGERQDRQTSRGATCDATPTKPTANKAEQDAQACGVTAYPVFASSRTTEHTVDQRCALDTEAEKIVCDETLERKEKSRPFRSPRIGNLGGEKGVRGKRRERRE